MIELSPNDLERFANFRVVMGDSDCWAWRSYHYKGYGMMWAQGRNIRAHRIAYELAKGEIPHGLVIDHLCRNPGCVNPGHLEAVTSAENTKRGIVGEVNRLRRLGMTHCKRGHAYDQENTVTRKNGARTCRACLREIHQPKAIAKRSAERAERRALKRQGQSNA